MNFFNRKPKAVAPVLAEKSDLETRYELALEAITTQKHTIETQDKDLVTLQLQLEIAHGVQTSQAEVIAAQKGVIENLEKRLEDVRVGDTLMAEGYEQLVERQKADKTTIASLEQAVGSLVEQRTLLQELSRRAIRLLLQPGGMRLPWQAKRKQLLEDYKAVGIEDE